MMNQQEQKSVVKLVLGGSLAALACYMGEPTGLLATLGQNLAAGVGVNLVSAWADRSVEALADGWFGEAGSLNHDVERVLGEALGAAARDVKDWLKVEHTPYRHWVRTDPPRAEGLLAELSELERDGVAAIREWAGSSKRRAEIAGFMQGRGADLEQAFGERVQEAFKGYEDEVLLTHDLRKQLTERWQAHFVARLKTDEAARVACEQLWRAALQEGLERVAMQQAGAMQALQQELEALKTALPTVAPQAATDEGLVSLFRQALSDWLAEDWANIVALLAKIEQQQAALWAGQQELQATTRQIEAQGDVLLDEVAEVKDEVEEVKVQGDLLLDEIGEAKEQLVRIERLIIESQRVQQVAQKRRLFCGVRTLPAHYIPRKQELADLRHLLMSEQEVALIALTGMGGMGKTVLAQALAHHEACVARYPDGVLWGELGPQADDEQAAEAILIEWALAAGLVEQMGNTFFRLPLASKSRVLANHLQHQHLLFVVDDVWYSQPARLLIQVRGPNSGLLVTTRSGKKGEALHLTGYTLNQLQPDEALALLAKRRKQPLSEAELPLAEELVQRLGYHPLAVELAAAQLSLPGRDWQTFLTPLRQQQGAIAFLELERTRFSSLQLCFDLSYERLEPQAQKAYRWLGVMATEAPFRWEDVQALWYWTENARSLFHTLLDAALLEAAEAGYRQHLLLRKDALSRLTTEEQAAALTRHGRIYHDVADLAERAGDYRPIARDYAQIEAILRRSWQSWQEAGDSSAALRQTQKSGLTYPRQEAFELLNNLVSDCYNGYWDLRGLYESSLLWLPRAAELAQKADDPRAQSGHLNHLGLVYVDLRKVKQAIDHYNRALEISRQIGDKRGEGNCLGNLGAAYYKLQKVEQAIKYYEQALEISRQIKNERLERKQLDNLGLAYANLGEIERAIEYHKQAFEMYPEIEDKRDKQGKGKLLNNLGLAYYRLEEVKQAIEYYKQALEISREIGDKEGEGNRLGNLGLAYADLEEVERAKEHYEQALKIHREIGYRHGEANHLANLGVAYEELGQMERARVLWQEALQIYEAVKSPDAEIVRGWLEE